MFGRKRSNPDQSWVTGDVGVINNTSLPASVDFPEAWTARVQTPVRRVVKSDMSVWANDIPTTWGGPM